MMALRNIGSDSFDSAAGSLWAGFNRGHTRVEGKRNNAQVKRQYCSEMLLYDMNLDSRG